MVDRIVPAKNISEIDAFEKRYGVRDAALLYTEPFRQWVIEDNFAAGRPPWECAGAQFVTDVAPYEEAKLRMLNGAHSTIAYLGFLSGYEFVHQAMRDRDLRQAVDRFMKEEAAASFAPPDGFDIDAYRLALQARFDNPVLQHRTFQIAMDGSQKLPQRFLGIIRAQLKSGGPIIASSFAIAGWMRFVLGATEKGEAYTVQDPIGARLTDIARTHEKQPEALCQALLDVEEIFSTDLKSEPLFVETLTTFVVSVYRKGVSETLRGLNRR
jgi:fructuronate reductase